MGVNSEGEHGSPAYVDRRLMAGGALLMTGGFLACLAGATIGAVAVVNAGRRYVASREEPPAVAARRRFEQARTATAAGYGAWQEHGRKVAAGLVR